MRDRDVEERCVTGWLRLQRVVREECVALQQPQRDLATWIEIDARAGWNVDGERAAGRKRQVGHRPRVERVGARRAGGGDDQSVADRPTASVVHAGESGNDDAAAARCDVIDRLARFNR